MKRLQLAAFVFLLALISILFCLFRQPNNNKAWIVINKQKIFVEVAHSPEERTKGLSGRKSLGENEGMLFVYGQPDYYSFWMKGMNFPLDFVWIRDKKIVGVDENISPKNFAPPKALVPPEKVDWILEINAGTAEKLGIKVGDDVLWQTEF